MYQLARGLSLEVFTFLLPALIAGHTTSQPKACFLVALLCLVTSRILGIREALRAVSTRLYGKQGRQCFYNRICGTCNSSNTLTIEEDDIYVCSVCCHKTSLRLKTGPIIRQPWPK